MSVNAPETKSKRDAEKVGKKLPVNAIESVTEINTWLSQFSSSDRNTVISLLMHLRFVSRDEFSEWFDNSLKRLIGEGAYALYAVRKLEKTGGCTPPYFDLQGNVVKRPSTAQGSEDFVYSLIIAVTY